MYELLQAMILERLPHWDPNRLPFPQPEWFQLPAK